MSQIVKFASSRMTSEEIIKQAKEDVGPGLASQTGPLPNPTFSSTQVLAQVAICEHGLDGTAQLEKDLAASKVQDVNNVNKLADILTQDAACVEVKAQSYGDLEEGRALAVACGYEYVKDRVVTTTVPDATNITKAEQGVSGVIDIEFTIPPTATKTTVYIARDLTKLDYQEVGSYTTSKVSVPAPTGINFAMIIKHFNHNGYSAPSMPIIIIIN